MTEREMEDLLWDYPDKILNEPLKQFQRQPSSAVGRADLIFEDRIGRLLVIELKRDTLERGAINQLVDYYGMLKARFPEKAVELMIVASRIPAERRLGCEQHNIEAREISQKRFRDVAEEVGYTFKSEAADDPKGSANKPDPSHANFRGSVSTTRISSPLVPTKVKKAWYFWKGNGRKYFLAFVNAKGSCSIRVFETEHGILQRKEYKSGDYQDSFSEYVRTGVSLYVSRQPNLERDCKDRLPLDVLVQLQGQIGSGSV